MESPLPVCCLGLHARVKDDATFRHHLSGVEGSSSFGIAMMVMATRWMREAMIVTRLLSICASKGITASRVVHCRREC